VVRQKSLHVTGKIRCSETSVSRRNITETQSYNIPHQAITSGRSTFIEFLAHSNAFYDSLESILELNELDLYYNVSTLPRAHFTYRMNIIIQLILHYIIINSSLVKMIYISYRLGLVIYKSLARCQLNITYNRLFFFLHSVTHSKNVDNSNRMRHLVWIGRGIKRSLELRSISH
jgi:hypothetical protein